MCGMTGMQHTMGGMCGALTHLVTTRLYILMIRPRSTGKRHFQSKHQNKNCRYIHELKPSYLAEVRTHLDCLTTTQMLLPVS